MNTATKKFRTNIATFCIAWGLVIGTAGFLGYGEVNTGIFTTIFGFGAGMLSVGRFGKEGGDNAIS